MRDGITFLSRIPKIHFAHSCCFCDHLFAVVGVLKGYDQLLNIVLDEASEYLRGPFLCLKPSSY